MTPSDIAKIASDLVQNYIFEHSNEDEQKLLLKHRQILGLPTSTIAQQIGARKKMENKVPLLHAARGIVYPPSPNLEQSSSEATAKFKVEILLKELPRKNFKSAADLTGGFGIDSFFLSRITEHLDFVEPNEELTEIVKHNFRTLNIQNVNFHDSTAEEFLNTSKEYDFVFIDPSRRDSNSKKVFRLADSQPNVQELLQQLFECAEFVLIKTSPLLDIHQGLRELRGVKKAFVVSAANECKELLFLLQKSFSGEPIINAVNLDTSGKVAESFPFTFSEEKNCVSNFSEPLTYLYEPNASILKAGAFKIIGKKFELQKLHPNTHLYTSTILKKYFPGRVFKVEQSSFDPKTSPVKKANVITRNYPLKAEELKKKLKLEDGGQNYVIGFSGMKKKHVILATRLG